LHTLVTGIKAVAGTRTMFAIGVAEELAVGIVSLQLNLHAA